MSEALVPLCAYLRTRKGACSGISFIDSMPIAVCHNRRIHSHQVFDETAKRGKNSVGWFYGFKLHLIVNDCGELLAIQLTTHDYRVNMANLFSKMKDTVVFLFTFANPLPVLHKLWLQMTQTIEPIRPNRTFQRNKHLKPRRFPMNYKPLR